MNMLQDYQIIKQIECQVVRIQKQYSISINVDELKKETNKIFKQENEEKIKQETIILLGKLKIQILQIQQFTIIENQINIKSNNVQIKLSSNGKFSYFNEDKGIALQILTNQCVYNGQILNKRPNGEGCFKWQNGELYIGQWLNAQKHGFGKWIGLKGDYYIGQWVNGQQDGLGEHNWNGNIYLGQWTNSVKNGYGVEQFPDGDTYIGNYYFGQPQGQGEYRWNNGSVYSGQFYEGKRNGYGKWKNINGFSYEGEYQNDTKNGTGKLIYPDGSSYYGRFINDMRDGHGIFTQIDGTIIEGEWKENKFIQYPKITSQIIQKEMKCNTTTNKSQMQYETYMNSYYHKNQTLNNKKLQLKIPQLSNRVNKIGAIRAKSMIQPKAPISQSNRNNTKSTSVDLKEIYFVDAQQTIRKNNNKFKEYDKILQSSNVKKSIKNVFVY